MRTAFVVLGRHGDVINALPLVLHDYQQGNHPTVVVGQEWAGLLDGIGYADKLIWTGDYSRPLAAKMWVEGMRRFSKVYVPQCYGQRFDRKCTNFCEEAWRLTGMEHLWNRIPLVFDRRNKEREQSLIPPFKKPLILVNTEGISSAFNKGNELFEVLRTLRNEYEIVDLSLVKAHRFFDLLGLYEKAEYLVCIDSGPLHLAQATPDLKVIAMISDRPDAWHGSPERRNHVLRIKYSDFDSRKCEISEAIRLKKKPDRKLIHVWSKYNIVKMDARRRHQVAKMTWQKEMDGWIDLALEDRQFSRTSLTDFGDYKSAPYVTDMIDRASAIANPWDIIVLTNDDTCVCSGISSVLRRTLAEHGACWSARREHRRIDRPMTTGELMRGRKHVGADLFAFTKQWWTDYGHLMPDMFMAFENWDYVLRTIVMQNGGIEIEGLCYHEIHLGDWLKNRKCAAAKHNQQMGGEFFASK